MPKPTPEQQQSLNKVTQTRADVEAKLSGLREHFEAQYRTARDEIRLELDRAVREAFDDGNKKEWIKRAYDTRDFNTIQKILDRTPSTRAAMEEASAAARYSIEDGDLIVNYLEHGPERVTGYGRFEVIDISEGPNPALILSEISDGSRENDMNVVRVLDGRDEGFYFEEAKEWLMLQ